MARIKQHQYEVKKEDIVSTMETIISVSDSEANSFIESLNPVGSSRYYSASVGNTFFNASLVVTWKKTLE